MAGGPCGPLSATGTGDLDAAADGLCPVTRGPTQYNWLIHQGDDFRRTIRWERPPGTPAADLTGAAIAMQIRQGPADTDPSVIAEISVGDGVTITDGPNATFEIYFSAAKTILLVGSSPYRYDLQVTPAGGDRVTIMMGQIYFNLEVTR